MTKRQRSRHMSKIRSSGTAPEMIMRQMLWKVAGLPMRFNAKNLPGKPDIVVSRIKLAVFVDGCFWHGCPDHGRTPKSNKTYWRSKIVGNMVRDEGNVVLLEEDGWTVMRIWEHDLWPDRIANTRRRVKRRVEKLMNC